jgi:hypothetical protein
MAKGACCILIPDTLEGAFIFVVELLKGVGASLVNPANGKITSWTHDGVQVEVSDTTVVGEVTSGNIRNIQFWTTGSDDVFVSWNAEDNGYRFSFYLDGLDAAFALTLTSKLSEVERRERADEDGHKS